MQGIILVNKGKSLTSFQVISRLRKILNEQKIGHSGTLDPNAQGLLVVLVGKSTKILPYIDRAYKTYQCKFKLGTATDTYDCWGEIISTCAIPTFNREDILKIISEFLGPQTQIPPIYSAIKVKGRKLYEYARNKQEVDIKERFIEIFSMRLLDFSPSEISLEILCSAGTYIRTICVDFAKKLGTLGCMNELIRLKCGDLCLEDAFTLEQIANGEYQMLSNEEVLKGYPFYEYNDERAILDGKPITIESNNDILMITKNNLILACYQRSQGQIFVSKRGFW